MSEEIKITPEQEKHIDVYVKKYNDLIKGDHYHNNWSKENVTPLINWQYKLGNNKPPVVILVDNPYEAQLIYDTMLQKSEKGGKWIEDEVAHPKMTALFNMIQDGKEDTQEYKDLYAEFVADCKHIIDTVDVPSKMHENYVYTSDIFANVLIAWYGFLIDIVGLKSEANELFLEWRDLYEKAGVYNAICAEKICICSRFPEKFYFNEANQLHNVDGLAVRWKGKTHNWKSYYINGRNIQAKDYEVALNGELTREMFMSETNEDTRAAWYEILGTERMMELLGAEEIDSRTIVHKDGGTETHTLYKTKETFREANGNPLAWVKFVCASTGTNYLIDVEPHHTNATEAAASTSPFFGAEITGPDDYRFDARA